MEEGEVAGNGAAGNGSDPGGETAALAVRSLRGDLRDWLLDQIRNLPKPWHQMSESEQRTFAFRADEISTQIVARAVDLIAADGHRVFGARVDGVSIETKGIKAKLVLSRSDEDALVLLGRAQGGSVMVVVADAERFLGERGPARVDPEQPTLPLETLEEDPDAPKPLRDGLDDGPPLPSKGNEATGITITGAFELGRQEPDSLLAANWLAGWDGEEAAAEVRQPDNLTAEREEGERIGALQPETSSKRRRRRRPPDQPEA